MQRLGDLACWSGWDFVYLTLTCLILVRIPSEEWVQRRDRSFNKRCGSTEGSIVKLSKLATVFVFVMMAAKPAFAKSEFPFQVNRDSSGKLVSIEMSKSMTLSAASEEDELKELRAALAARAASPMMMNAVAAEIEEEAPLQEDERQTYEEAKEVLGEKLTSDAATDKRLDGEFAKAKDKVAKVKAWRLLAAPYQAEAFNTEKALEEVVKQSLSIAKEIFSLASPAFSVFEFLVDSHIENLVSRREFFQNALLVAIEQDTTQFTKAEKDAIRSSIFYSRLSLTDLSKRDKARKAWPTYGNVELQKLIAKCDGYVKGKSAFGPCFKVDGQEIRNRLVSKNKLSKSASLAFDYSEPKRVRAKRQFLMITKLGLKLLPVPSLLKKPVKTWLNSQYITQRKTEGFLLGWTRQSNETRIGEWVIYGSANPLISK
jgi:hypothetical protein